MNAKGSGLRQLTHDNAYAAFPAWSPDGQTIAYASYRGQGYVPGCIGLSICPSNLYLIDASGGEPCRSSRRPRRHADMEPGRHADRVRGDERRAGLDRQRQEGRIGRVELSPGGAVSFPAWSPDGTQILFLRMLDGTNHIWTVTPDDSGHHDIVDTRTDTNFGRAVWSPDGTTIAFARPYAGATAVWTIDRYGNTPPERIAGWPGIDGAPIAWQPVPSGSDTGPVRSESPSADDSPTATGTPSPNQPRSFLRPHRQRDDRAAHGPDRRLASGDRLSGRAATGRAGAVATNARPFNPKQRMRVGAAHQAGQHEWSAVPGVGAREPPAGRWSGDVAGQR